MSDLLAGPTLPRAEGHSTRHRTPATWLIQPK